MAKAPADGYTLFVGNVSTNTINENTFAHQLQIKPSRDLLGIAKLVEIPHIIATTAGFPANSIADLIPVLEVGEVDSVDTFVQDHSSGIRVLLAPPTPEMAETITPTGVKQVLDLLRRTHDLVVVDFLESPDADRVDAVRAGRSKVRRGGYLLLDDSDRPAYADAFELLDGWRQRRFAGVKDGWPQAVETAIFRRPLE